MKEDNEEMKAREDVVPPAYDDSKLKNSIKDLQHDLKKLGNLSGDIEALRKEIAAVKEDVKKQFAQIKKDLAAEQQKQQQEMQAMKNNLNKWHDHLTYGGSYNVIPKV